MIYCGHFENSSSYFSSRKNCTRLGDLFVCSFSDFLVFRCLPVTLHSSHHPARLYTLTVFDLKVFSRSMTGRGGGGTQIIETSSIFVTGKHVVPPSRFYSGLKRETLFPVFLVSELFRYRTRGRCAPSQRETSVVVAGSATSPLTALLPQKSL